MIQIQPRSRWKNIDSFALTEQTMQRQSSASTVADPYSFTKRSTISASKIVSWQKATKKSRERGARSIAASNVILAN